MNRAESKYFSTAKRMDEALIMLLREKNLEYVTIKEICARASVNRSTFYLHYENIGDLLLETIEMINERFHESQFQKDFDIEGKSLDELFLVTDEWIIPYLKFIKENKYVYKAVHSNAAAFGTEKAFDYYFQNVFSPILLKYGVPEDKHEYLMEFYRGGLTAVIMRWVDEDCEKPVEIVMEIISLIFNDRRGVEKWKIVLSITPKGGKRTTTSKR